MKLPNGYGSVYKLSGSRRKPYAARVTIGWQGKQLYKYVGYYKTKAEALLALAEYNKSPHQKSREMTFSQVYEKWAKEHFKTIKCSGHYERSYNASCSIHDKVMADITKSDLQAIIDNIESISAKGLCKTFFNMVWQYAEEEEIISKDENKTNYLKVPQMDKSDKHTRFSNSEMEILWNNSDDEYVRTILTLIYTGARPMELFSLKSFNIHDEYFRIDEGKTKNAIRDVPIHYAIKPFFKSSINQGVNEYNDYQRWVKRCMVALKKIGIENHTVYDCRHTFASLWADNSLNEMYRRTIQGHSARGIGEKVYTHISLEKLKEEIDKLPVEFGNTQVIHKFA